MDTPGRRLDTPGRRRVPLADDPDFLDSLTELDRGLTPDAPPDASTGREATAAPPAPSTLAGRPLQRSRPRVNLPPSIARTFDALTVPEDSPSAAPSVESAGGERSGRRPLLALFPPERTTTARTSVIRPAASGPAPSRPKAGVPAGPTDQPRRETVAAPPRSGPTPYERFYGLQESAFALDSDPRFFYHSTLHDEVSQRLLTAIREREGLVVLTGEAGIGKTTLCRAVVEQLDRRTLTSFVGDPFESGEALLTKVLADFGVLSRDDLARGVKATPRELSTTLQSFIESSLAPLEASAVIIVDEAQNAPAQVLDELRMLCEAAEASSHFQVILVGEPRLTTLLRNPANKALQKRVAVRCTLAPLPLEEIDGYLNYRLAVAGSGIRVEFDQSACERLHRYARGVPRALNRLADRALARGYEASAAVIDAALVDAAARDLKLTQRAPGRSRAAIQLAVALAIAFFVSLGAGVAAWVFRDAVARSIASWKTVPPAPQSPARPSPTPLKPSPPPER